MSRSGPAGTGLWMQAGRSARHRPSPRLLRTAPLRFTNENLTVTDRADPARRIGQLVVDKLARRIIGWNFSRYEPLTHPADAPRGPIVATTDGYASSGGDLVIQALKPYGIATFVGTRTWGSRRIGDSNS